MKIIDGGQESDNRLPRIPIITDEMQTAIDAAQAQMARNHPINASNREFERATARINELEGLKGRGQKQTELLAEAYAVVGNFELAGKTTKDKDKRKYYKDIWKAIWKEDSETCKCPDTETVDLVNGMPVISSFSPTVEVKEVYSFKHGQHVTLRRCNKCNHLNAS